jgi:hypothetical protein
VLSTGANAGIPVGSFRRKPAEDAIEIDTEHDGPWFSVSSRDGARIYRNKNVPAVADVAGKQVQVDPLIEAHEGAEFEDLQVRFMNFREEHNREPTEQERVALYLAAHKGAGVPAEKAKAKEKGVDWGAWNAWCRGVEAKLERGPFDNEPQDADVRPIPHKHAGEETAMLAAQDSFTLAFDRALMGTSYYDPDQRLHVIQARISKATVSPYRGKEIPGWDTLGLEPDRTYRLLRDPEELQRAASTFNRLPLLISHLPVSAANHAPDLVVGATGSNAAFSAPYITNDLVIWSREGISAIESGAQRELSLGYHYRVDPTPGTYDGEHYDLRMFDLCGNHLALVAKGRAGPDVAIETEELELSW